MRVLTTDEIDAVSGARTIEEYIEECIAAGGYAEGYYAYWPNMTEYLPDHFPNMGQGITPIHDGIGGSPGGWSVRVNGTNIPGNSLYWPFSVP